MCDGALLDYIILDTEPIYHGSSQADCSPPLTILQHFSNFNIFAMSDNIHTGYHIAIPDDIWREDINSIGSKH